MPKAVRPAKETEAEKLKRETLDQFLAAVEETGIAVVVIPEYARRHHAAIFNRDYSALLSADARVFQWLDELVERGMVHRGPYGHDIAYYSPLGTRSFGPNAV